LTAIFNFHIIGVIFDEYRENMSDIARLLQQPRSTISEDLEKLVQ
jgi:cell fate (sporulation/competence/biofilm development) regulator YmcA (YheA/YmcA/DUF963 family)